VNGGQFRPLLESYFEIFQGYNCGDPRHCALKPTATFPRVYYRCTEAAPIRLRHVLRTGLLSSSLGGSLLAAWTLIIKLGCSAPVPGLTPLPFPCQPMSGGDLWEFPRDRAELETVGPGIGTEHTVRIEYTLQNGHTGAFAGGPSMNNT